jgi:hypothetical protein
MFVPKFVLAGVLSIALLPARAGAAEPGSCSLGGKYQVTSVAPYRVTGTGYYTTPILRGAEIGVAAQPGLTSEWLQKTLQDQVATGACDFGAPDVSVQVMSAGPGFSVMLTNPNERTAGQILGHAKQQLSPGAAR